MLLIEIFWVHIKHRKHCTLDELGPLPSSSSFFSPSTLSPSLIQIKKKRKFLDAYAVNKKKSRNFKRINFCEKKEIFAHLKKHVFFYEDVYSKQLDLITNSLYSFLLVLFRFSSHHNFRTDLTAIGYDCYHFSSKGLSMFHTAIWNLILTQDSLRSHQFRPHYQPPRCADPLCPFIRTKNNSALCNWNFPKTSRNGLRVEEWIAIGIFATAVTLCAILLIALCCGRGRDQVITEALKPVGADWSCITRFIDEDSVVLNSD
ncbi:unnamed protein product [Enterobius vermicularis]|uniref:Uncharacterized protein n=1 Tax=Enterobius vermicularis TaxID=51028 RepID=A0A0N4V6H1_ENTVE|nr:unnamed protein product [Enterobius vermicularis]